MRLRPVWANGDWCLPVKLFLQKNMKLKILDRRFISLCLFFVDLLLSSPLCILFCLSFNYMVNIGTEPFFFEIFVLQFCIILMSLELSLQLE